ncbi:MAG: DUF433 domain-containing protein [Chloroflexi bacterium]|nr:MAG: DUF433 domain-containing protein [Chloroflexota bacterium]
MARASEREIAIGITIDPNVCVGKPVVKGTRVPISVVLEQLALGASVNDVAEEYGIRTDDVLAVLRYAHEVIAAEDVRAI